MVDEIIQRALAEDIGTGDITTLSIIPRGRQIMGKFITKEDGVVCGLSVVERVFKTMDSAIQVKSLVPEGSFVSRGDIIVEVEGSAMGILTGERVALNFIQRLSGIATKTAQFVKRVQGTKAKIVDTRKTTPGLRVLEKYAVKVGGGCNHRFNLSDGILIKDNHILAAGGIQNAIAVARKNAPHTLKIEVEIENMEQMKQALQAGVDIIMLDNMDAKTMRKAVEHINGRTLIEASGNIGEKNVLEIAKTGVDFISIGALTHTVKAMDISLKFI